MRGKATGSSGPEAVPRGESVAPPSNASLKSLKSRLN